MTFFQILPWFLLLAVLAFGVWLQRRYQTELAARRQSAAALRATQDSLQRMHQAIESASDAIGIGDFEGNSLYHNRAHIALFGYTVEELNSVPGGGVLFADPVVARAIHTSIRAGYSWSGESTVRTKDGRIVPCLVRADIIRDEHGEAVGIFGVFTDITERLRAQRLLDEQRQRLEVTLQSIGDAVITTDVAGRIVLINPVAQQMTGCLPGEAAGRPLGEVLRLRDEHSRESCPSAVLELLARRTASHSANVYFLAGPDDAERLVAENAALIKTASGEVVGAVLALRDITRERARADEAARAGKLESLGLMAGSIAHDFGNLLAAMAAHVQLALLADAIPEDVKKRLDEIDRVVWRARDVTKQLTTFASGGESQKRVISLGPLVREAADFAVQNSSVRLVCEIAADLRPVEADDGQLVQVINNLAVNAVQAMPGGGTLTIRAANRAPGEDSSAPQRDRAWVEIEVADTGTGIPPEHLQKIFEPFFTTKAKGTGLGLATCYSIVKKHGGQLRVESTVGRGTTFRVVLPAVAAAAPTTPARQSLGRVLVISAENGKRESLRLMLGLLNYDSADAADGPAAIERCRTARGARQAFDVVLLDANLPGEGAAAALLRSLREGAANLPVVAVGVRADEGAVEACRAAGFSAVVSEPSPMTAVAVTLREVLRPQ